MMMQEAKLVYSVNTIQVYNPSLQDSRQLILPSLAQQTFLEQKFLT